MKDDVVRLKTCYMCKVHTATGYGSSRCRLCNNIYYRKYRQEKREKVLAIHRKSRKKIYSGDYLQRWKDYCNHCVRQKIRQGVLKTQSCLVCGAAAQAHHDSYLPQDILAVRWLCQPHHAEWHRMNKPLFPTWVQIRVYKARPYRQQGLSPAQLQEKKRTKQRRQQRKQMCTQFFKDGMTLAAIASKLGVSRQRIYQIIKGV